MLHQRVNAEDLKIGDQAPDFKLSDSEKGNILAKQSFKGKLLFIFYNNMVHPCQIDAENLAKYDDETGGDANGIIKTMSEKFIQSSIGTSFHF